MNIEQTTVPVVRADRRRAEKEAARHAGYTKTKFVDRAAYVGVQITPQRPGKDRLTPEALHNRGVERMIRRNHLFKALSTTVSSHELARLMDTRAPHANRSTAERRHFDRAAQRDRAREAYQRGLAMPQPLHHKHAAARFRAFMAAEAPLAMAA